MQGRGFGKIVKFLSYFKKNILLITEKKVLILSFFPNQHFLNLRFPFFSEFIRIGLKIRSPIVSLEISEINNALRMSLTSA